MTTAEKNRIWVQVAMMESIQPRTWYALIALANQAGLDISDFLELDCMERQMRFKTSAAFERWATKFSRTSDRLTRALDELSRRSIGIVSIFDPSYPSVLKQYLGVNSPPVLFYWGNLSLCSNLSLAMVGTRYPSAKGSQAARSYSGEFASREVTIVSGNARGVDNASHYGALENRGSTCFVLPMGILNWRARGAAAQYINETNTLILSQWPPDRGFEARFAIYRTKVIAALSDGVFVVETGLKGGASYAVKEAIRTRKPMYTLLYNSDNVPEPAAGNRSLLSVGAKSLPPLPPAADASFEVNSVIEELNDIHMRREKENVALPREQPDQIELSLK